MIEFFKMSGSGNDFILIDDRDGKLSVGKLEDFVRKICERRVSVGADGLIVIRKSDRADFSWRFFNADGSEVDMCGNGGRCAARFAFIKGIAGQKMSFVTGAGIIDAEVKGDQVKLRLTDPQELRVDYTIRLDGRTLPVSSVNTGVPHVVSFIRDLESHDVFSDGRLIRYNEAYQPAGTNANFVRVLNRQRIRVRTYERGVEDETLACGTGAVASALISAWKGLVDEPVDVLVKSGETLKIYFSKTDEGFKNVYLEGGARVVYEGNLWDEGHNY
ncbi:MAG TPA: diaminopimelate epimerase [Syntrophales bacterium]|nr:diaminopimelate epimerase [Syntrophales bacterium]HPI57890.1 diaminopimelate epimerase [Syntrophales bacterium]HPN24548.1 diaminopimelate epimerase [Syntrophales bacterium]HQM28854.1 diaminopimelate epimerase [Syntrophales bacterium]